MGSEAESESWLQHAEWIPESRGGLVLVKDNDIYYRSDYSWAFLGNLGNLAISY